MRASTRMFIKNINFSAFKMRENPPCVKNHWNEEFLATSVYRIKSPKEISHLLKGTALDSSWHC
jgi:hypothetical protein